MLLKSALMGVIVTGLSACCTTSAVSASVGTLSGVSDPLSTMEAQIGVAVRPYGLSASPTRYPGVAVILYGMNSVSGEDRVDVVFDESDLTIRIRDFSRSRSKLSRDVEASLRNQFRETYGADLRFSAVHCLVSP